METTTNGIPILTGSATLRASLSLKLALKVGAVASGVVVNRKLVRLVLMSAADPVRVSWLVPDPVTTTLPMDVADTAPSVAIKVNDKRLESVSATLMPTNAEALPWVNVDVPSAKIMMGSAACMDKLTLEVTTSVSGSPSSALKVMDALSLIALAVKYNPARALLIFNALPYNSIPLATVTSDNPLESASCRLPNSEVTVTERLPPLTSATARSLTNATFPAVTSRVFCGVSAMGAL